MIDRAGLAVARWPAGTVPWGAYATVDSVANRVAQVTLYKGEAIVPGRLAPQGIAARLDVRITPGKRAYALRVDDLRSLAGMVQPNARVDIMVVMEDAATRQRVAKLIMENMRVLGIGAAPEPVQDARSFSAGIVLIEVTPAEAERLAIAAAQGSFQLAIRGYGDPDSVRTTAAVTPMRDLLLRGPRRP
jgi:pilus assembly protein CpaB